MLRDLTKKDWMAMLGIPQTNVPRALLLWGTRNLKNALFAEGKEDIDRWAQQGFSAVDMETAATFAVAEHFGMDRGSLLAVFDNPCGEDHILSSDTEKDARRAAAQEVMVAVAIATIKDHVSRSSEPSAAGDADKPGA